MRCWFCQNVKGKRTCPARAGELICARCCGTNRRVEIHCPEDCPYLHGEHDPRWESEASSVLSSLFAAQFVRLTEREADLLARLHIAVLKERAASGGLTDREALEVISTLAKTFETLSKGIVYEHASENPRLQAIVTRLGQALQDRKSWLPEASDRDVLEALERLSGGIKQFLDAGSGGSGRFVHKGYLDTAARLLRFGEAEPPLPTAPETRLIVEP